MEENQKMFRGPMDVILFVLMSIILLGVSAQIAFRYVFKFPFSGADEIVTQAFVFMVFVGALSAIRTGQNIKIDIFGRALPSPFKEYLEIAINILMLLFVAALVVYGTRFAFLNTDQVSITYQVPKVYYYMVLPVCGLFMGIAIAQNVVRTVRRARSERETRGDNST